MTGVPVIHTLALVALVAGCHKLPIWSGEVEVTPASRPAVDRCGDGAPTTLGASFLWRHPYLQSVTGESALVAAGLRRDAPPTRVVLTTPEGEPVTSTPLASGLSATTLDGLRPGSLYCYQLVSRDGPLTRPGPLATAPPPGTPIHFVALGDVGYGGEAQRAIAARLTEVPFDLIVFAGDLAYPDGTPAEFQQKFFDIYRDLFRIAPAFTAIGNHERHTNDGAPYFAAMFLPDRERYYSFDWGDVHFVALDTTRVDRGQLEWLDRDLAATRQRWVIAFGHHPLFSSSLRGPRTILRRRLLPILRRHRVDLMIAGHEHHYERFRPIGGITGIVTGGGGAQLTRSYGQAATARRVDEHHFIHFDVSQSSLGMRAISIDGEEIDRLELRPIRRPRAR